MTTLRNQLKSVAAEYAQERGKYLTRFLGDGNDGAVWETSNSTAVKALERRDSYVRERDAYLRLRDHEVNEVRGFAVPFLIDYDDTKQAIEITVVFPPCIIDFAKAYVDRPPDYTPEVLRDWKNEAAEMFDSDNEWEEVERLLHALEVQGIFYFDAKPGNIRFGK